MAGLPHYPVGSTSAGLGAQHYAPQPPYSYPAPHGPGFAPPMGLADLGSRLGARVLDVGLWFVGYFLTGGLPLSMWIDAGGGETAQAVLVGWLALSFLIYFPVCVAEFGSTLGKRICKVRVVDRESGLNIGFWRALLREVCWPAFSLVPVLGLLNSLWCCWDRPYQQCLHDKLAETVAIER
ncbi:hypothetical protein DMH12_21100 [Streptomyces sp. WAC 04229]|nr:hypothetical protein DMH12_21100 [Streptomyces sp. WAC 04229]